MEFHGSPVQLEAGAQQAALTEIRDLLLEQREAKRSQAVLLRVLVIALLSLSLAVILTAAILIPKVMGTLDQIQTAAAAIDPARLDAMLGNLETFADKSVGIVSQAESILSEIN